MKANAEPTPELAATLARYLQIQAEEQRLKEEKAALRDKLGEHMARSDLKSWFPEVEGQALRVRCTQSTVIEYNETVLKDRLGERFRAILAPDPRKIRQQLAAVSPLLDPVLDQVGAPSPERVRAAIEAGIVKKEEFAGAFTKTVRRVVGVSKVRLPPVEPAS